MAYHGAWSAALLPARGTGDHAGRGRGHGGHQWLVRLPAHPARSARLAPLRTHGATYARSARAFFHWLARRDLLERNPFDQVAFPRVGRPRIQTIEPEEFDQLLQACASEGEAGWLAERAAARNRAVFWLFYLLHRHRPGREELAEWDSAGEDHLFLSETRTPLTKNGVEMLFKRVRQRAGLIFKRISPHILRHTFAINYLAKSNDPFSLQELLRHEDMATVKLYMHMRLSGEQPLSARFPCALLKVFSPRRTPI